MGIICPPNPCTIASVPQNLFGSSYIKDVSAPISTSAITHWIFFQDQGIVISKQGLWSPPDALDPGDFRSPITPLGWQSPHLFPSVAWPQSPGKAYAFLMGLRDPLDSTFLMESYDSIPSLLGEDWNLCLSANCLHNCCRTWLGCLSIFLNRTPALIRLLNICFLETLMGPDWISLGLIS